jgi:hypothetical protein
MDIIKDEIIILKETINNKQKQIVDYTKNIGIKDNRSTLRNLLKINHDAYQYVLCDICSESTIYVKTIIYLVYSNHIGLINYKENISFTKYYDNDGNELDLNYVRKQKFPNLSESQINIMNRNTPYRGIIPNFRYVVEKDDIENFLLDNKQYISPICDDYIINLPVTIPISFL